MADRYAQETCSRVQGLLASRMIEWDRVELVSEAGSTAHNISAGDDDLDFTVIWTEALSDLVKGDTRRGSQMIRTRPEGERSGPGDIDLQVYSMRRFVQLAQSGNPSVLMILFTPERLRLRDRGFPNERIASMTRSRQAGEAFIGYLDSQRDRWQGHNESRAANRPELLAAHGYDTKYAAHAIRLGLQGIEYLQTGCITMPMPENSAARLRGLRAGELAEVEAIAWCDEVRRELESAHLKSRLPDSPDAERIAGFLLEWHAQRL